MKFLRFAAEEPEMSLLSELEGWYSENCDGDWEHQSGIKLTTLDNPGWYLEIDLDGTRLEKKPFVEFRQNYGEAHDWIRCWVDDKVFRGACGTGQLEVMISKFVEWAGL
jgi:hypothetical protein